MRAVTIEGFGGPEVLRAAMIPVPRPGPHEALVRIGACGVNRLDLDVRSGHSRYALRFPHVLGREPVGEVVEVGAACRRHRSGDRVLVRAHFSCGQCRYCLAGTDNHCLEGRLPGIDVPGGYAEYLVAPERALVPLPASISFTDAAAVQIAFGTAWHVLVAMTRVRPGDAVLVTGAGGGVGTAAVQLARYCGARVIAAAGSGEKLARLADLGAAATINYEEESLAAGVRRVTDGVGVDIVVETVGGPVFGEALEALAVDGRLVVVGAHAGEVIALDLVALFRKQASIVGSRRVTTAEVERVIALVAKGVLRAVINEVHALEDASLVHAAMEQRIGFGKWVLVP